MNPKKTKQSKITKTKASKKQDAPNKMLKSDALFKSMMTEQLVAREFLEEYLPDNIKQLVDLSQVTIEPESFVDDDLTRQLSDIVYSVKTKDTQEPAFIYVLAEQQSEPCHYMALRLIKYTILLLERHADKKGKLPLVFPVVFYTGQKKYDSPMNIWDLSSLPEIAKNIFTNDYKLINLSETPDDEIAQKKHIALFQYVMKHIRQRDILKLWQDLLENFKEAILIDETQEYFYIKKLLWYSDAKINEENEQQLKQLITDHLTAEQGEEVMRTIAQKYIEQGQHAGISIGEAKGIAIGEARGEARGEEKRAMLVAQKMLKKGIKLSDIAELTELPLEKLKKLRA